MTTDPEEASRDEATRYGLIALLRRIERENPGRPRIGTSRTLAEETVRLQQDPLLAFPVSDLSEVARDPAGNWRLKTNVLGLFGPQGPLPLSLSEEALRWSQSGDPSYAEFANIFATRFLQLYFRAWSDSHGISQHDRPEEDRFAVWLGAFAGSGTPAFRHRDTIDEATRVALASIGHGRVRSPVRLRQILELALGDRVSVEEHRVSWIAIEPDDRSIIGRQGSTLGGNIFLGANLCTVNDQISLSVEAPDLARYRSYLPGGPAHQRLCDLVFWYLHDRTSVSVSLSLPASQIPKARLGASVELGWMAAVAPAFAANDDRPVKVSTFLLDLSRRTVTSQDDQRTRKAAG
jgi:type VI secretion system protein ImpH